MSKRAVNLLRNMAVPFKRDATNPNYGYHKVISAAAAKTLTPADSGAIIYWTQSNAHDITLPAAKAGLCFTFHIVAGSAHNHYIVTETDDVVYGKAVVMIDDAAHDLAFQVIAKGAGKDKVWLKSDATTGGGGTGDMVHVYCDIDGYWFCNADLHTTGATIGSVVVFQD